MMEVYLSYDDEDKVAGNRLKLLLKPLTSHFGFTTWSMQDISPGTQWQKEMASHLEKAWMFLPIISADYLSSDRCTAETQAALTLEQRGKLRIVNILLRTSFLEYSSLATFPILPSTKPITRWNDQDKAWLEVQTGILATIKKMQLPGGGSDDH